MRKNGVIANVLYVAVIGLLLAGCGATKSGFVAKNWSDNIQELRIVPVFPPREDFQVGDVYASGYDVDTPAQDLVDANGNPILQLWVASLPVASDLAIFYGNRAQFPATPSEAKDATKNTIAPEASGTSIFSGGNIDRLRAVAFPAFLSARVTGGELGGLVPTELLNFKGGLSGRKATAANISVPYAESYGLPAGIVLEKYVSGTAQLPKADATSGLKWSDYFGKTVKVVDVLVVTEVFYARTFDITIETESNAGATASGELKVPSTAELTNIVSTSVTSSDTKTGIVQVVPANTSEAVAAREKAALAAIANAQGATTSYPGFSVKAFDSARGDIGLRRTYIRPIAIGYRGMTFRYVIDNTGKATATTVSAGENGVTRMSAIMKPATVRVPLIDGWIQKK